MDFTNNTQDNYLRAKEKVAKLRSFYRHATIYGIFCIVFIWLNIQGGSNFPWAIFPIIGWGFGVLGHASETFEFNFFFGRDWEDRKIKEMMDNERF